MTGNPNYLSVSSYKQYYHPLVQPKQGDIIIEGGICDGQTTKAFAKNIGAKGHVYAFEPLAEFVASSRKLLKETTNVTIEPFGIWSSKSRFYIENKGGATRMVSSPNKNTETCHSTDIDSYVQQKKYRRHLLNLILKGQRLKALRERNIPLQNIYQNCKCLFII